MMLDARLLTALEIGQNNQFDDVQDSEYVNIVRMTVGGFTTAMTASWNPRLIRVRTFMQQVQPCPYN